MTLTGLVIGYVVLVAALLGLFFAVGAADSLARRWKGAALAISSGVGIMALIGLAMGGGVLAIEAYPAVALVAFVALGVVALVWAIVKRGTGRP